MKTHKKCPDCKCLLPIKQFYQNKTRSDNCTPYCKDCTKKRINEHYAEIHKRKYVENSNTHKWCPLSVDHNHLTGEIRGLLCQRCNQGLGSFLENPEILNKAILYLKTYVVGKEVSHGKTLVYE